MSDALREVRLALLEADVHFRVAKEFIARVKDKAMGEEVLRRHSGSANRQNLPRRTYFPSGRGCFALNLANPARSPGRAQRRREDDLVSQTRTVAQDARPAPLLIACDLQRPAAIQQLATLGEQIDVRVFQPKPGEKDVLEVCRQAASWSDQEGGNVEIYDTAGRQEIDEPLVEELRRLRRRSLRRKCCSSAMPPRASKPSVWLNISTMHLDLPESF